MFRSTYLPFSEPMILNSSYLRVKLISLSIFDRVVEGYIQHLISIPRSSWEFSMELIVMFGTLLLILSLNSSTVLLISWAKQKTSQL